jgi:hypothetical protein
MLAAMHGVEHQPENMPLTGFRADPDLDALHASEPGPGAHPDMLEQMPAPTWAVLAFFALWLLPGVLAVGRPRGDLREELFGPAVLGAGR